MIRQPKAVARGRISRWRTQAWLLCLAFIGPCTAWAQQQAQAQDDAPQMVAVSADIVEISGSLQRDTGFAWPNFSAGIAFAEKLPIPGILKVGDFERQTSLQTTLKMLEQEGKAQLLSNPKVIVKNGEQGNFVVGGDQPYPVTNAQGVGVEFKKFGVILNVVPTINPNKKESIDAQLQIEVSNPDFSKPVTVGNTSVPSITTRQMQTRVEIKSGETLVIGGLKSSAKNISKSRVPFLGRIPVLGLLFTTTSVIEEQKSLFLFITLEVVK